LGRSPVVLSSSQIPLLTLGRPVKLPFQSIPLEARHRKAVLFDESHSVAVPRNFFGWSGFFCALFCHVGPHFGSELTLVENNCSSDKWGSYFSPVTSKKSSVFTG
jgi:hypothetical protein